jgi:hypothetical protein
MSAKLCKDARARVEALVKRGHKVVLYIYGHSRAAPLAALGPARTPHQAVVLAYGVAPEFEPGEGVLSTPDPVPTDTAGCAPLVDLVDFVVGSASGAAVVALGTPEDASAPAVFYHLPLLHSMVGRITTNAWSTVVEGSEGHQLRVALLTEAPHPARGYDVITPSTHSCSRGHVAAVDKLQLSMHFNRLWVRAPCGSAAARGCGPQGSSSSSSSSVTVSSLPVASESS